METSMDITAATKIYHWRFGPLTVLQNNGREILAEIDDIDGISCSYPQTRNKVAYPTKYPVKDLNVYFFCAPEEVKKIGKFDPKLIHRYFNGHNHTLDRLEIERLNTELSSKQNQIKNILHEIEITDKNIKDNNEKKENIENEKKNLQNKMQELSDEINQLNTEIDYFTNSKSPREVQSAIDKIPAWNKRVNKLIEEKLEYSRNIESLKEPLNECIHTGYKFEMQKSKLTVEVGRAEDEVQRLRNEIGEKKQLII